MRITFVLPWIEISGGNRVIFELANRLDDRGHKVSIVYPLVPNLINSRLSAKTVLKVIFVVIRTILHKDSVSWFPLKVKPKRIFSLKTSYGKVPDADCIIATSSETAEFVEKTGEKKGVKFYFPQHYEVWNLWNTDRYWNKVKDKMGDPGKLAFAFARTVPDDSVEKKLKDNVDNTYRLPLKIITTSSWLQKVFEEVFDKNVQGRVTLAVNFEQFYPDGEKSFPKMVLAPFRNIASKGDDDVLDAFRKIRDKRPETKFILYGTRKGKKIPSWIEFRGQVAGDSLRRLYSSATVFIYPSWVEGYGLPPMEAMACGTACITTTVGAVTEYAVSGKTAIIVPPRSPDLIAKECIDLLKDDNKCKEIASNGFNCIKQFTWERTVKEFELLLKG